MQLNILEKEDDLQKKSNMLQEQIHSFYKKEEGKGGEG